MEYIKGKQGVTYDFLKELLAQYNINLEEEKKLARIHHANNFKVNSEMEGSEGGSEDDASGLNVTANSDNQPRRKVAKGDRSKSKKRDHMFQLVEWNFKRREGPKEKKERLRKDHASFPIVMKMLEKFKSGKEIKDVMAIKSAARYIYNIYMGKASDFAQEKQLSKKPGQKDSN